MKITTVFFDLDGTLLPMDEDLFIGAYFKGLTQKLLPHGYDKEGLVSGIWSGTKAMIKNDGSLTNEEMFWKTFTAVLGEKCVDDIPVFDDFYRNEFQKVQSVCGYDPEAKELIAALKAEGLRLVLATNPLFPALATHSRTRWAGLDPEDFSYISTYENSRFSKPSLRYYQEILDKLSLRSEECLMVGNNVDEDMIAKELGMKVFLCPAHLLNKQEKDISSYPQGKLSDVLDYIHSLQQVNL